MRKITADQMKKIEDKCESIGISKLLLMENAGRGLAEIIVEKFNTFLNSDVLILAGLGNNGGDGFVAARHLAAYGVKSIVVLIGKESEIKSEIAKSNWKILSNLKHSIKIFEVPNISDIPKFESYFYSCGVIVDAIFGTGIRGEIRDSYAAIIELANRAEAPIIAVDVPSGLDPSTGALNGKVINADITVSFHMKKTGLIGKERLTGHVIVLPLGIPKDIDMLLKKQM